MYISLKVSLDRIEPSIWRSLIVPAEYTLNELHHVIQIAMGWTNSHLYKFSIGGLEYTLPQYDSELLTSLDSQKTLLRDVVEYKFKYLYDFGDYWEHTVEVTDRPPDGPLPYAECKDGKYNCPPEDVGGVSGFKSFLSSMLDPDHPDREENLTWFDKEYDFTDVDFRSINYRLKNLHQYVADVEQ